MPSLNHYSATVAPSLLVSFVCNFSARVKQRKQEKNERHRGQGREGEKTKRKTPRGRTGEGQRERRVLEVLI